MDERLIITKKEIEERRNEEWKEEISKAREEGREERNEGKK